jgi:hypothetical protein
LDYSGEIAVLPHSSRRLRSRRIVNFAASVRDSGSRAAKIRVSDLTQDGCRVVLADAPEVGTEVWLKVTGLNPLRANVAWARDGEAGCEFSIPLDAETLEALANKPKRASATTLMFGRRGA